MDEKPPTTNTPADESPTPPADSSSTTPTPATGPHGENSLLDWLKLQAAKGNLGGQARLTITLPSGEKFTSRLKKP
jgi:hypothetical protein